MATSPAFRTVRDQLAEAPGALLAVPVDEPTPFVAIDLSRMERNLSAMAEYARHRGIALRPHAKTHRTPQIARRQVELGAKGICVAKLSEAEVHIDAGIEDVLVAYPMVGRSNVERAIGLSRRSVVRLCVDGHLGARGVASVADDSGEELELHIIIDTGLGRDGVSTTEAVALAREIEKLAGVRFGGILTHEGHAYRQTSAAALRQVALEAGRQMVECAQAIAATGIDVPSVSVGSTATARITPEVEGITEMRPGGYPFYDYGQVLMGTVAVDECAARIVATVVSAPAPGRALVDAGSNMLGRDSLASHVRVDVATLGLVAGLPGWNLHAASEEHGWLRWEGDGAPPPLDVGERIQVVPNHICTTFHNAGRSILVDRGTVIDRWQATARGCSW